MGMYTEIYVKACIKDDPQAIIPLKLMTKLIEDLPVGFQLDDHPFFKTDRWTWMLRSSSYYFVPLSVCRLEYNEIAKCWSLVASADLKNYTGEIGHFFDWLKPYVDELTRTHIGHHRYEEEDEPTLVYSHT